MTSNECRYRWLRAPATKEKNLRTLRNTIHQSRKAFGLPRLLSDVGRWEHKLGARCSRDIVCHNILQNSFIQAKFGHKLLQPCILFQNLFKPPYVIGLMACILLFQAVKRLIRYADMTDQVSNWQIEFSSLVVFLTRTENLSVNQQ